MTTFAEPFYHVFMVIFLSVAPGVEIAQAGPFIDMGSCRFAETKVAEKIENVRTVCLRNFWDERVGTLVEYDLDEIAR